MTDVQPAKSSDVPTDSKPTADTKTGDSTTDSSNKKEETSNAYYYVFIGFLSVVLILLLYYAYCRFVENSVEEPFVKGQTQERDDPVIDFNLRESIKELQNLQRNIMSTISENSDI